MANSVIDKQDIVLYDDVTTVTIKPLNIAALRKFFIMFDDLKNSETNEDGTKKLTMCAGFCLAQFHKEAWKSKDRGELDEEYIESQLSNPHVVEIIKVCTGLDLNAENLQRLAEVANAA